VAVVMFEHTGWACSSDPIRALSARVPMRRFACSLATLRAGRNPGWSAAQP